MSPRERQIQPADCPEEPDGKYHDLMGIGDECPVCHAIAIDDVLGLRLCSPDEANDRDANEFTARGMREMGL